MKQSKCPNCNQDVDRFNPEKIRGTKKNISWYKLDTGYHSKIICSHCKKILEYRFGNSKGFIFPLLLTDILTLPRVWKENHEGVYILVTAQLSIFIILFIYQRYSDVIYKVSNNQN